MEIGEFTSRHASVSCKCLCSDEWPMHNSQPTTLLTNHVRCCVHHIG